MRCDQVFYVPQHVLNSNHCICMSDEYLHNIYIYAIVSYIDPMSLWYCLSYTHMLYDYEARTLIQFPHFVQRSLSTAFFILYFLHFFSLNFLFEQKQPVSIDCLFVHRTYFFFHRFSISFFGCCISCSEYVPDFIRQNQRVALHRLRKHRMWNKINLRSVNGIWNELINNYIYSLFIFIFIQTDLRFNGRHIANAAHNRRIVDCFVCETK